MQIQCFARVPSEEEGESRVRGGVHVEHGTIDVGGDPAVNKGHEECGVQGGCGCDPNTPSWGHREGDLHESIYNGFMSRVTPKVVTWVVNDLK